MHYREALKILNSNTLPDTLLALSRACKEIEREQWTGKGINETSLEYGVAARGLDALREKLYTPIRDTRPTIELIEVTE